MIKQIQNKVVRALQKANIPFILYGSTVITDRETNDVDIIVKKDDFDRRVNKIFKELGYHEPVPFIFEKKFQNGSRYNIEIKYDLHPKITKTLDELWGNSFIDKDGIRKFKPIFHALVLATHTDRHIKEGLFDSTRIADLNKINVDWKKVLNLAKEINDTGLAYEPVNRIVNLLHNPNNSGYSREELLYPQKKILNEDKMTVKLLSSLLPTDIPDEWDKGLATVNRYRRNRIKEYRNYIKNPDYRIAWEVGYPKQPIIIARRTERIK